MRGVGEDGGGAVIWVGAPSQHVEERVDVRLGGEVEARAHVALDRAHVGEHRVVELVHALLFVRARLHAREEVVT